MGPSHEQMWDPSRRANVGTYRYQDRKWRTTDQVLAVLNAACSSVIPRVCVHEWVLSERANGHVVCMRMGQPMGQRWALPAPRASLSHVLQDAAQEWRFVEPIAMGMYGSGAPVVQLCGPCLCLRVCRVSTSVCASVGASVRAHECVSVHTSVCASV